MNISDVFKMFNDEHEFSVDDNLLKDNFSIKANLKHYIYIFKNKQKYLDKLKFPEGLVKDLKLKEEDVVYLKEDIILERLWDNLQIIDIKNPEHKVFIISLFKDSLLRSYLLQHKKILELKEEYEKCAFLRDISSWLS